MGIETETDANNERTFRMERYDIPDESVFKVLKELDKNKTLKDKLRKRSFFDLDRLKNVEDLKDQIGESEIDEDLIKNKTELDKLKDRLKNGNCEKRPRFITMNINKSIGSACHNRIQCASRFCDMCSWTCQPKPTFNNLP